MALTGLPLVKKPETSAGVAPTKVVTTDRRTVRTRDARRTIDRSPTFDELVEGLSMGANSGLRPAEVLTKILDMGQVWDGSSGSPKGGMMADRAARFARDRSRATRDQRGRTRDAATYPGNLESTHEGMAQHHKNMASSSDNSQFSEQHLDAAAAHEAARDAVRSEPQSYHTLASEAFQKSADVHGEHAEHGHTADYF